MHAISETAGRTRARPAEWVPPEDRPLKTIEQRLEEHYAAWQRWLRRPRRAFEPLLGRDHSGEPCAASRDERSATDVRYYEAAVLGFDVFSDTPASIVSLVWFFALPQRTRLALVQANW